MGAPGGRWDAPTGSGPGRPGARFPDAADPGRELCLLDSGAPGSRGVAGGLRRFGPVPGPLCEPDTRVAALLFSLGFGEPVSAKDKGRHRRIELSHDKKEGGVDMGRIMEMEWPELGIKVEAEPLSFNLIQLSINNHLKHRLAIVPTLGIRNLYVLVNSHLSCQLLLAIF